MIDFRQEIEYGVLDNLQLSIYYNSHYVDASADFPAEDPARPGHRLPGAYGTGGEDVHPGKNPATPYTSYHFDSVSVEAIYRLMSPYTHPFGLALYLEPEWGPEKRGVEAKLLLQKDWLEDRLVWALNINYEYAQEKNNEGGLEQNGDLNGLPACPIASLQNGMLGWNSRITMSLPTLRSTNTQPTSSDRRFITEASAGG